MRLLIVGQIDNYITKASEIASRHGASVSQCPDIEAAFKFILEGKGADAVMVKATLDIKTFIENLKREHITIPIISYGIDSDSKSAVASIKAGAQEYIPLPPDEELIAAILEAATEENDKLLFKSEKMAQVVNIADKIAPSNANILITGNSGTGKEVISRYIHNKSNRKNEPFVSVNCAAIPDNLLESELFGHEKGAFTGAASRRIGKFEESNNGTLLLDEISEMDIRLQAKLLRAIQEQIIYRVGGNQEIKLNLRILATSNRDLKKEVEEGTFREDLLFRLNVIEIKIPPLHERIDDILVFSEYFINKYSEANHIKYCPLSNDAKNAILSYSWPGNVRELENTMHRAVLLNDNDEIMPSSLLLEGITDDNQNIHSNNAAILDPESENNINSFVGRSVDSVEKELILGTLDHCLGNRTHAANILGISIRTLRNKIKIYNETVETE